jgi:hypothetical protein
MLFQKRESIDNIMWTCIILHNMILTADGRDQMWEHGMKWDSVDGLHDLEDDEWAAEKHNILNVRALRKLTDYSAMGRRHFDDTSNEEERDSDFFLLRVSLINHYHFMHKHHHDRLMWLN